MHHVASLGSQGRNFVVLELRHVDGNQALVHQAEAVHVLVLSPSDGAFSLSIE